MSSSWRLQKPPKPRRPGERGSQSPSPPPDPEADAAEQKSVPQGPDDDDLHFMADYGELQEDFFLLYMVIKYSELSKTNNAAILKHTQLEPDSLTWLLTCLKDAGKGKPSEDRITKRVTAIVKGRETIERDQISNARPLSTPNSAALSIGDRSSIASATGLFWKFRSDQTDVQNDILAMEKRKVEDDLAAVKKKHQREHEVSRKLIDNQKAHIIELERVNEETNSKLEAALKAKPAQRVASIEEHDVKRAEPETAADIRLHRECQLRLKVQQNEIEVLKDEIDKARSTIEAIFQEQKEVTKDLFAADLTNKDLGFNSEEHHEYRALADELGNRPRAEVLQEEAPTSSFDPQAAFDPKAWNVDEMFASGPKMTESPVSIISSVMSEVGKRRRLDHVRERPTPHRDSGSLGTPSMIPSPLHLTKPAVSDRFSSEGAWGPPVAPARRDISTQTSPVEQSEHFSTQTYGGTRGPPYASARRDNKTQTSPMEQMTHASTQTSDSQFDQVEGPPHASTTNDVDTHTAPVQQSNDAGTQTLSTTQVLKQAPFKMIAISPREIGTRQTGTQTNEQRATLRPSGLITVSIAPETPKGPAELRHHFLTLSPDEEEDSFSFGIREPRKRWRSLFESFRPSSGGSGWIWLYMMWFIALLILTYREKEFWNSSNELKRQAVVAWRDDHWESELLVKAQYKVEELLGIDRTPFG